MPRSSPTVLLPLLLLVPAIRAAAAPPLPVGGADPIVVMVESIETQPPPPDLAERLNAVIQRLKRETVTPRRLRLEHQRVALERLLEESTGFTVRGYARPAAGGGVEETVNLVLVVDAAARGAAEPVEPGDLVQVTLQTWLATSTAGGARHYLVRSMFRLPDHPRWLVRPHGQRPWSVRAPDATLAAAAQFTAELNAPPLGRRIADGAVTWLHALRLTSAAARPIASARLRVTAYTRAGELVGPFDVHVDRRLEPGEPYHLGLELPDGQVLDRFTLEVQVQELEWADADER